MCLSECHCDPLHRLSITRLSPASVHLRFHGSRSRPPTIDDQHGRSPPHTAYPRNAPTLSVSLHIIPRCIDCSPRCPRSPLSLSLALFLFPPRHPTPPHLPRMTFASAPALQALLFIFYSFLFPLFIRLARCSCLCCSPFASARFQLQLQFPLVMGGGLASSFSSSL